LLYADRPRTIEDGILYPSGGRHVRIDPPPGLDESIP
jgi:hypothetical protein